MSAFNDQNASYTVEEFQLDPITATDSAPNSPLAFTITPEECMGKSYENGRHVVFVGDLAALESGAVATIELRVNGVLKSSKPYDQTGHLCDASKGFSAAIANVVDLDKVEVTFLSTGTTPGASRIDYGKLMVISGTITPDVC